MTRRRAGFSRTEVLIALAFFGILANVAIPAWMFTVDRARALAVVSDFMAVREAAEQHRRDHGTYPPDGVDGREPEGLREYLRGKVSWSRSEPACTYDWESWVTDDGEPERPTSGVVIGLSVRSADRRLLSRVSSLAGGDFVFTGPARGTFLIERSRPR